MSPSSTGKVQRSVLSVPATSRRFIEKALATPADAIVLDLEDAVTVDLKTQARADAIAAVNGCDWGNRTVTVRVNGLDTPWGVRDILEVVDTCPRLDRIVLPKCDSPMHVAAVDLMLGGLEAGSNRSRPVGIEGLIESAKGIASVEAIAAYGGRLQALIYGGGDYQLDMHTILRPVGGPSPRYVVLTAKDETGARQRHWNDPWHFALARLVNACRANGLLAIDGPFTGIDDPEGLSSAADRTSILGFDGKWAIHPSQLEAINAAFSPTAGQLVWAREALEAMRAGHEAGRGAVRGRSGEMLDLAQIRMANFLLGRDEAIRRQASGQ